MDKIMVAPSILSADFSCMGEAVSKLESWGADMVHCDVMDGVFVPNITFGMKMVKDIRKCTQLPLDVHLMIDSPEKYLGGFIDSGADYLTFHYEATSKAQENLEYIRSRGVKSGIVISPDTEVSVLKGLIKYCDMVLLMSVYPGFGGQSFIEKSIERLHELSKLVAEENPNALIEIDGGVSDKNAKRIAEAGANVLVAGNSVFNAPDPKLAVSGIKGL